MIVTGHSLGGALAQVQVATVFGDRDLRAAIDIRAVTFSALGARDVIDTFFGTRRSGIDEYAKTRVLNYVRKGDGLVQRRVTGPRPQRIGTDVEMEGVEMEDIAIYETIVQGERLLTGYTDPATAALLSGHYYRNHILATQYHPDFVDPVDDVFARHRVP